MPRQFATILYLVMVALKKFSIEKTLSKYEKLKSHKLKNIDFAKSSDV